MATGLPDGLEDCLETRLNRATNPLQTEENWEYIVSFCDMINKDIDGPQTAVRLIIHKIQSPQEKESLFALTTLEACVKNCGLRFQQEIGKYRFINEVIKVISPKYLGNQMSGKVKARCIKLLYVWSSNLKHEPKITEAYSMLKKQGIVKEDPVTDDALNPSIDNQQPIPYNPPPPHASPSTQPDKNQIFNDAEKSKLLSKLLKSKNPDDLQAANRLIKSLVKQDEERVEKVTRRTHQLETVMNNVKLLNDMLKNYQPLSSNESDVEIMKELSENIEKQRPALFKLASDSDEKDASGAIGEILKVNDEVIQVLSTYDSLINKSTVGKLLLLDNEASNEGKPKTTTESETPVNQAVATPPIKAPPSASLIDEQLLPLDLFSAPVPALSASEFIQPNPPVALTTAAAADSTAADLSSIFSAVALLNAATTTSNNFLPSVTTTTTTTTSSFYSNINTLDPLKQQPPLYQQQPPLYQQQQPPTLPLPPSTIVTTTTNNNNSKYNIFSDSFNNTISTTTTVSSLSSSSSSGLDVLNQMLAKTLKDSGMKTQVNENSVKKVSMNEIHRRPSSPPSSSLLDIQALDTQPPAHNPPHPPASDTTTSNNLLDSNNQEDSLLHIANPPSILTQNGVSKHSNTPPDPSNPHLTNNHTNTLSTKSTTATEAPTAHKEMADSKENKEVKPLKDVAVSLESFKPGKREPMQLFSKDGVTCKLHFSDVRPRDDVSVIAMTTTNTSALLIEDFTFLATVSKGAKVKVQPPNGRTLAPFNPILPPPLISQLILIANPNKEAVKLKFTISYLLDDNIVSEMGQLEELVLD